MQLRALLPALMPERIARLGPAPIGTSILAVPLALLLLVPPASAYVALMAGQQARPLGGTFNTVPVLHSNQPEEVEGPGILINTAPGMAVSAENGLALRNAEYTFNGEFGIHVHHKYFPPYRARIAPGGRRSELTLALILINSGTRAVHIRFENGAVRNSFEAPYLANNLMGVKPLGMRPWNTGPGDATAVQMLRGKLDFRLSDQITVPARSRLVLFRTQLPALGIANGLLRGHSDGPFQMAVVAASNPQSDAEIVNILDQGRLAPGRVYLKRIAEINNRQVFSRVGGVAVGDTYTASLAHDLTQDGPLHVPLTSTNRHHFGTREIQVNGLATRMLDSSLDNVGTYGVRFDVDLKLTGQGPYELVMSHPVAYGGKPFTAFRGSLQVRTDEGLQEMHVGLRSGQSLSLVRLNLKPGVVNPVRVSLVYPADATPGHLLSVVPSSQLARVQQQARQLELAKVEASRRGVGNSPGVPPLPSQPAAVAIAEPSPIGTMLNEQGPQQPIPTTDPVGRPDGLSLQSPAMNGPSGREASLGEPVLLIPPLPPAPGLSGITMPPMQFPPTLVPPAVPQPRMDQSQSLVERYQQALEAQQQIMRGLMTR